MVVRQTLPGALLARAGLNREAGRREMRSIAGESNRVGTLYSFAAYQPAHPHPRRPRVGPLRGPTDLSHFVGEV
jgi:hypothetical protein